MSDTKFERRVGEFHFTVGLQGGKWPDCTARDERWRVLATALSSTSLDDFSKYLHDRTGYSQEGVTGFSYSGDGEVPEGKVFVFFRDQEQLLDEPFFEAAAAEYGLAALECLRAAGRPASSAAEKRFKAVRDRSK